MNINSASESSASTAHKQKHIKLVVVNKYKLAHINAKNVIVFVTVHMKHYYNKTHQSQFFNVDDAVNL